MDERRAWERGALAARRLVYMMIAVVVSALVATAIAQYREWTVDRRVEEILGDAMPSVVHLSTARSRLGRLRLDVASYARTMGGTSGPATIAADRRAFEDAFNKYLALPFGPGEREALLMMSDHLATTDELVARIQEAVERGNGEEAIDLIPPLARACEATDGDLAWLVQINASQGLGQARAIEGMRRGAVRYTVGVDGFCVGLAASAMVLAVRELKRTVRLLDERSRVAEDRARILAERASELGEFSGRVAHDVLSPLGSVGVALDVARRRTVDARTRLFVDRGLSSLGRVRRIVDGLLDFARSGAPPDRRARAVVGDVVRDTVDGIRPDADGAGVEVQIAAMAAATVACSPGVLTSLVSNLLRNAVKYMDESAIRKVTVRVLACTRRCRVEVEDTGPGIPPALSAALFNPYVRVDRRTRPGLGLGLATVKRLAQAHGGQVGVTSVPGCGSTFWFELPLAEGSPTATGPPPA